MSRSSYSQQSAWAHKLVPNMSEWMNQWINKSMNELNCCKKIVEDWTIIDFLFCLVVFCGWRKEIRGEGPHQSHSWDTVDQVPCFSTKWAVLFGSQEQQFYCTHCRTLPGSSRKAWWLLQSLHFPRKLFISPQLCHSWLLLTAIFCSDLLVDSMPVHCLRHTLRSRVQ